MLSIRATIDAAKRRKFEETGEEGFSLIELIIVVVVLGILVAIAIPIFLGIQDTAKQNAADAVAANAATQFAAATAQGNTATFNNFPGFTVTVGHSAAVTAATIDDFCVKAVGTAANNTKTGYAGPSVVVTGGVKSCPGS